MRRAALILILVAVAACQLAEGGDADRAAARALMVEEIMEGSDVSRDIANDVSTCALDRMSDGQVRALLAATSDDQREAVMESIADQEAMMFCMLGAGILEGAF